MCLATSNNLLLVLQDAPKCIFSMNSRSSGQPKNDAKTLFFHPPSPFHGNFRNCNSIGICTALQFQVSTSMVINSVKQRLLRNWPGSALRPLATSCAKDYKAHSLWQTSFAKSPNKSHKHFSYEETITCISLAQHRVMRRTSQASHQHNKQKTMYNLF